MNIEDTAEEAAFRAEVRAFLEANAVRRSGAALGYETEDDAVKVPAAKRWQAIKAKAGFAGITWPKSAGGRGGKPIEEVIFRQEEKQYAVPRGVFEIAMNVCIPAILDHGTPEQHARHVAAALRGDEIWCQLFSEPGAGSDLAGLRTQARRDGDDWIIDGQKTWTSSGHYADFGLLIARTDPTVPKHEGMTTFILDMRTPGVEVRPIRQMSGTVHSGFNDVFFSGVRISDAQRVGAPGKGWKVTVSALNHERYGLAESPVMQPGAEDLFRLACEARDSHGNAPIDDAAVRDRVADLMVRARGVKYTGYRTLTALSEGRPLGAESSIVKLVLGVLSQDISMVGIDLLGLGGMVMNPDIAPMGAWFQNAMLATPPGRIAGGTDEVLRNIVAERILGLPEDMRADKNVPFNQIRTGSR